MVDRAVSIPGQHRLGDLWPEHAFNVFIVAHSAANIVSHSGAHIRCTLCSSHSAQCVHWHNCVQDSCLNMCIPVRARAQFFYIRSVSVRWIFLFPPISTQQSKLSSSAWQKIDDNMPSVLLTTSFVHWICLVDPLWSWRKNANTRQSRLRVGYTLHTSCWR